MKPLALSLLFTLIPLLANADTIYRCTTAQGGVLITNSKIDASCRVFVSGQETTIPAPSGRSRSNAAQTPSPAGFPRVSAGEQKARDTDRRRIQTEELASEKKALEEARKKLAEQESIRNGDERNYQRVLDRLQPFKEEVAKHERNIELLTKELNAGGSSPPPPGNIPR